MSQIACRLSHIAPSSETLASALRSGPSRCAGVLIPTSEFVTFLLIFTFLLPYGIVHADGIAATDLRADYSFAQRMTFYVTATSDADITSAVVVFRAGSGPERRGTAAITPGKTLEATYEQQLVGGVLPPFSMVSFWWELSDAAGRKLATPPRTVEYLDNRFTWQQVTEGILRVRYYTGDTAYARAALDVARSALPRVNQELAAPIPPHVDIYLYAALDDLQSALLLAGRDWQGGQARPDLGVVLVAIPPGQEALAQMKRDIPHELTHLLVFQATGAGYTRVPRWLDEGLASANEELPQPAYQQALESAFRAGRLISLETLCAPFSADAGAAQLSYAESLSVAQFIRNRYPAGIRKLLGAYAGGATCSGGVEQAFGLTLGALELMWRASLGPQAVWLTLANSIGTWALLAVMVSLALVPFAFTRHNKPVAKRKSPLPSHKNVG
jgi:hypothetical protein